MEMTYAIEIMQAAIDNSNERCAELSKERGKPCNTAAGWAESKVGKVGFFPVAASGVTTNLPHTVRGTWKVNGKRIARDKLIALLNG